MTRRDGIIPARAGFTRGMASPRSIEWDHPRSRGVYSPSWRPPLFQTGSSPLARGLRGVHRLDDKVLRIIPARAGFTTPPQCGAPGSPDHPRSRGVYGVAERFKNVDPGSSPLARGLPLEQLGLRRRQRIIPARAGFTAAPVVTALTMAGSSPLARGLLGGVDRLSRGRGIIPARAGFTGWVGVRAPGRRDHPRSRGVYVCAPPPREAALGSSPLARGLQAPPQRSHHVRGIIPARAGFTTERSTSASRTRDHPRSRGVYQTADRTGDT